MQALPYFAPKPPASYLTYEATPHFTAQCPYRDTQSRVFETTLKVRVTGDELEFGVSVWHLQSHKQTRRCDYTVLCQYLEYTAAVILPPVHVTDHHHTYQYCTLEYSTSNGNRSNALRVTLGVSSPFLQR